MSVDLDSFLASKPRTDFLPTLVNRRILLYARTMNNNDRVAIIGSGPSALYLLQNMLRKREQLGDSIEEITVFDRESEMGAGMPYIRKNADLYNICNISSEEIPPLDIPFADWLATLDAASRSSIGVEGSGV